MKKIFSSVAIIAAVAAVVIGGTTAFFSDEEKSEGNTFTAGAIDLKVSNTSYVTDNDGKLVASPDNTWVADDLLWNHDNDPNTPKVSRLFFSFADLKPGDVGEDTIDLKVVDNDAWLCGYVTLTKDMDMSCTEPEIKDDAGCSTPDGQGELADNLRFIWWADDGDNVLEEGERIITNATLGDAPLTQPITITFADKNQNIWNPNGGPMTGNETFYVGKGWCFGEMTPAPLPQGGDGPLVRGTGFTCSGKNVNNAAQTDMVEMAVSFYAEQARNNEDFVCRGVNLPVATVAEGSGWSSVDLDELGGGKGKEWHAKARNNNSNFEIAVGGANDANRNDANTTWTGGQTEAFILSYDGSGNATLAIQDHPLVSYPVGVGDYGRIGVNVKAPVNVTTTVDNLSLNIAAPLSDNDVTVTGGTNNLLITGVNLNQSWNLSGTFVFSAVSAGSPHVAPFADENPAVQFSID